MEACEDTLASVLQNRPADCQVIVAHRGDYDDPYDLSGEVDFVVCGARKGWTELACSGADEAEGDILHILEGGLLATGGWTDQVVQRFLDNEALGTVAPLIVDQHDPERIISAGLRIRGAGVAHVGGGASPVDALTFPSLSPTGRACFYRVDAWDDADGWDTTLAAPWSEVDFALTLRSAGYGYECETNSRVVGEPAAEPPAGFDSARDAEIVFQRHRSAFGSGAAHWAHACWEALTGIARGTAIAQVRGRLSGAFDSADRKRFNRLLGELEGPERHDTVRFDSDADDDNVDPLLKRAA